MMEGVKLIEGGEAVVMAEVEDDVCDEEEGDGDEDVGFFAIHGAAVAWRLEAVGARDAGRGRAGGEFEFPCWAVQSGIAY